MKPEQNFGFAVAAGDVNGDGRADVIVGAYRGQSGLLRTDPATGYIRVFDGATGSQLDQVNSDFNGEQFGRAVAAADLTGDGRADIVGGARWGATGGHVFVIDGPTGAVIDRQDANVDFEWLGASVAATDGGANGTPRFAAGAYQGDSRSPNRAATCASGTSFRPLDEGAVVPGAESKRGSFIAPLTDNRIVSQTFRMLISLRQPAIRNADLEESLERRL